MERYQTDLLDLRLGDCIDLMRDMPDNAFDLAIVDPPYGLGESQKRVNQRAYSTEKWKAAKSPQYGGGEWDNNPPPQMYFEELKRVSKNQIIWGANHFGNMLPSSGWVVWWKKREDEVNDFSDAELAYTSLKKGCRLFHMPWIGFGAVNAGEMRIHPTQKPIKLYNWLLHNYAKPGDCILDTHLGSMSIAIACHYKGFHLTGTELDKDYFTAGVERVKRETAQMELL